MVYWTFFFSVWTLEAVICASFCCLFINLSICLGIPLSLFQIFFFPSICLYLCSFCFFGPLFGKVHEFIPLFKCFSVFHSIVAFIIHFLFLHSLLCFLFFLSLLVCLFVRSLIHSFVHLFICLFANSFVHMPVFVHACLHLFFHSFNGSS